MITSQKKLTYKFTINQRHVRFYYKVGQALLQTVTPLMYCEVMIGEMVQTFYITKGNKMYYKVGQVLKWGRYFKTG